VLLIWDHPLDPITALYGPYVPFELVLGLWLLIKGASVPSPQLDPASSPDAVLGER